MRGSRSRLLCSTALRLFVLFSLNFTGNTANLLASTGDAAVATDASAVDTQVDVAVGISGTWKLGHATPVRIRVPMVLARSVTAVEVATFDGDGVAVTYRQSAGRIDDDASSELATFWSTVSIGRSDQGLSVQLLDARGEVLARRELSAAQLGTSLPPTQMWIVAVGSSLGVEASSHVLSETGLSSFTTTVVEDPRAFPNIWYGLAGCDVLILATTGEKPCISGLGLQQWQAIEEWIERGGSAVISLGDYATRLPEANPLRELLPGKIVERLSGINTSPLEASTTTNVQLAPIVATRLSNVRGVTELSLLDNTGKRFAWWVRYSYGKGVINYLGSDLDTRVLKQWKDRRLVWIKLLASLGSRGHRDQLTSEQSVSGTQYLGYDDLVGQLRATLDFFPSARIFSFGEIALILVVILLLIGPLDYWLSVHWLRRPAFSWFFLLAILLASAAGLIWLEGKSRPEQLLVNSAQIVDFLPAQRRAIIDDWTHVYSSRARTVDLSLDAATASDAVAARLDWQGLPGKGLGGLESNLLSDQGMPAYTIHSMHHQTSDNEAARVDEVGIPTSGTKSFYTTWTQPFEPAGTSQLREVDGIDQVEGLLVNPLSQDLLRPVLMYHNWVYQLPTRFTAGQEIAVTYDMVPKDLMRRLNRRQILNGNDVITPWVPDSRDSLDRLLEIMMFYNAAGGFDYAKLQHRFQPRVDLSNSVALDQAILFGELAKPVGMLRIHTTEVERAYESVQTSAQEGANMSARVSASAALDEHVRVEKHSTWCRILIPVSRSQE